MIKHRRKFMSVIIAGLLVVIGFMVWSNQNNKAQISNKTTVKTEQVSAPYKQFDGKYMSFSYRSVYSPQRLQPTDGDLEVTHFTAYNGFQKEMSASVTPYSADMENNSAYKLRSGRPDTYQKNMIGFQNMSITEFTRLDNTEVSVFIPHGGEVVTVVMASNGGQDNLSAEMDRLLASWQWK